MAELKVKKRISIKWCFLIYIPICVIMSLAGSWGIGILTNSLQEMYEEKVFGFHKEFHEDGKDISEQENGAVILEGTDDIYYIEHSAKEEVIYEIICYAQVVLMPIWVLFCVAVTGIVFYKRELEKPLKVLTEASKKIEDNCLEFEITDVANNELGDLCRSFESMRKALYRNNQKTWRVLEERKQLNAAFAHDIRTPITILKGYTELLQKCKGTDSFSLEKKEEILKLMQQQAQRLENYVQKMSTVQKLEDIAVNKKEVLVRVISEKCKERCELLAPEDNHIKIHISENEYDKAHVVNIDEELVLEVFENLLTNALRYAKNHIRVNLDFDEEKLKIIVKDDGKGFSKEEMKNVKKPFYRTKQEKGDMHFGLGLYICDIICQRCNGELLISNADMETGAKVIAIFSIK